jgi:hypothetical protein
MFLAAVRPPLLCHIGHVVLVSAEEEMRRIATGRVVAAMKHEQAIGDGAVDGFVGDPVSVPVPPERPVIPIALWESASEVRPTRIRPTGAIDSRENRRDWIGLCARRFTRDGAEPDGVIDHSACRDVKGSTTNLTDALDTATHDRQRACLRAEPFSLTRIALDQRTADFAYDGNWHSKTPLGRASRGGGTGPEKAVCQRAITPLKSRIHLRTLYLGEE